MNKVFLMMGCNMGNRPAVLRQVKELVSHRIGTIIHSSSLFETEPWGFSHPDKFLNQCLQVDSSLSPAEILSVIQEIEISMGRKKERGNYQARIIDVDILFYNDQVIEMDDLIIPHPLISQRRFVLLPLAEIAPELLHPVLGKSVSELLEACNDHLSVKKVS